MARRRLRPYQNQAKEYFLQQPHPALFIEMRLGKTLTTIRGIKELDAERVLVVGPYAVFYGWLRELKLEREYDNGVVILDKSTKQRKIDLNDGLNDGHKYFFLSKEGHRFIPEIGLINWDVVVIDESTFLKSPKSGVSKYYAKYFRDAGKRVILTGSPDPEGNNILNYVQQLQFLDPSIFNVKSYWEFRAKYCRPYGFHRFIVKSKYEKLIQKKLADNCFFLKRSDVDMGGEKIYEPRVIKLKPKIHKAMQTLIEDFILEFDDVEIKSTLFAPTKFVWIRRLLGGFLNGNFVFDSKLKEVKELLQGELSNQQVVIWCIFIEEIEMLEVELKKIGLRVASVHGKIKKSMRDKVETDFKKGLIDCAVMQPECFKFGRDFSSANTAIYYSTPPGEGRLQSEDRVISAATNESNLIIDLICKNTIEEILYQGILNNESQSKIWSKIIKSLKGGGK